MVCRVLESSNANESSFPLQLWLRQDFLQSTMRKRAFVPNLHLGRSACRQSRRQIFLVKKISRRNGLAKEIVQNLRDALAQFRVRGKLCLKLPPELCPVRARFDDRHNVRRMRLRFLAIVPRFRRASDIVIAVKESRV